MIGLSDVSSSCQMNEKKNSSRHETGDCLKASKRNQWNMNDSVRQRLIKIDGIGTGSTEDAPIV